MLLILAEGMDTSSPVTEETDEVTSTAFVRADVPGITYSRAALSGCSAAAVSRAETGPAPPTARTASAAPERNTLFIWLGFM